MSPPWAQTLVAPSPELGRDLPSTPALQPQPAPARRAPCHALPPQHEPPAGFSKFTSINPTNQDPAVPDQALPEPPSVIQPQHKCSEHAGTLAETWPGCSWCVCPVSLRWPSLGLWNLHREQAPNTFLTSLKSNVGSAPSAPAATILLRAASCPTESPAEHPAILPCKEQGIVPNSAVLTPSATTTDREVVREKNPNS